MRIQVGLPWLEYHDNDGNALLPHQIALSLERGLAALSSHQKKRPTHTRRTEHASFFFQLLQVSSLFSGQILYSIIGDHFRRLLKAT